MLGDLMHGKIGHFMFHRGEYSKIWWFGTFFIFHNIWDNPSH
jgi:hypothetical protein